MKLEINYRKKDGENIQTKQYAISKPRVQCGDQKESENIYLETSQNGDNVPRSMGCR